MLTELLALCPDWNGLWREEQHLSTLPLIEDRNSRICLVPDGFDPPWSECWLQSPEDPYFRVYVIGEDDQLVSGAIARMLTATPIFSWQEWDDLAAYEGPITVRYSRR